MIRRSRSPRLSRAPVAHGGATIHDDRRAASTTAAPDDGRSDASTSLGVSYLAPPPLLTPDVFATITVAEPWGVAVTPSGDVVVLDETSGTALVVGADGSTRSVPVSVTPSYLAAAGPGDVVYGLHYDPTDGAPDASMVAIALAGDRAGEVVRRRR